MSNIHILAIFIKLHHTLRNTILLWSIQNPILATDNKVDITLSMQLCKSVIWAYPVSAEVSTIGMRY